MQFISVLLVYTVNHVAAPQYKNLLMLQLTGPSLVSSSYQDQSFEWEVPSVEHAVFNHTHIPVITASHVNTVTVTTQLVVTCVVVFYGSVQI